MVLEIYTGVKKRKMAKAFLICFVTVMILILVFVASVVVWPFCTMQKYPSLLHTAKLCLTTTPSRLRDPWILKNIQGMRDLHGHSGVILSIPHVFKKTGEPYEVPVCLQDLPGLRILRCEDEGPGTKLLSPLRESSVTSDTILMICDDDVTYNQDTFYHLAMAVIRDPFSMHCMCYKRVMGFMGYGSKKETLLPLLLLPVPEICFTVDDDFVNAGMEKLGIPLKKTSIPWCSLNCGACAVDAVSTTGGPQFRKGGLFYEDILSSKSRFAKTAACREEVWNSPP